MAWQHWQDGTALDAETARSFGIVVGIEFVIAALGAAVLAARRKADNISPWIALVVGVHLFPVAALLHYPLLHIVAGFVTLVALAAVPLARSASLAVSAVTGLGTGAVLLAAGLFSMFSGLFWP